MSCLAKIDPRSRDQATYFDAIEQGLQESIDRVFVNEKPVNVVHVQGRFLALAQNKVRMFSETLQRRCGGIDVYYDGGVRKGVRELLLKGGSIQVLLEGELDLDEGQDCSQHPLVVLADGLQAGGLEMRQASGKHMDWLRREGFHHHWMVMDESAYRLERDDDKTHGNTFDPHMARSLARIFDDMWKAAKPMHPAHPVDPSRAEALEAAQRRMVMEPLLPNEIS